jgi:hypothetical protein
MGTAGGGVSMVQAAIVKTVKLVSAADQRQLVPFLGYPPINLKGMSYHLIKTLTNAYSPTK